MTVKTLLRQSEVGIIPADWIVRGLLEVVEIASGQVDPMREPFRSMVLVAPDHIESGTGRLFRRVTASEQHAISGKYMYRSGTVIYSKIRPYLRKAILADFDGLCSADMYPLRPAQDADPGFILAVLLGDNFTRYAVSVSARTGMPKINRIELAEYRLAIPPTKFEQHAIADALSQADALIESIQHLIAKKRLVKQGAMQTLLTGKIRLHGFTDSWITRSFSEIAAIDPENLGANTQPNYSFHYIALENVDCGWLRNWSELELRNAPSRARRLLRKNDILVSTVRPNLMSHLLFAGAPGNWVCSTGFAVVRCWEEIAHAPYVFYHLFGIAVKQQIDALLTGSNYPAINSADVRNLLIPVPPVEEQKAVAAVLSDMDAELEALEAKLAKARAIKTGMMQELLTGKTRLV